MGVLQKAQPGQQAIAMVATGLILKALVAFAPNDISRFITANLSDASLVVGFCVLTVARFVRSHLED